MGDNKIEELIQQALDLAGDVARGAVDEVRQALAEFDANTSDKVLRLNKAIENLKVALAALGRHV